MFTRLKLQPLKLLTGLDKITVLKLFLYLLHGILDKYKDKM